MIFKGASDSAVYSTFSTSGEEFVSEPLNSGVTRLAKNNLWTAVSLG